LIGVAFEPLLLVGFTFFFAEVSGAPRHAE